MSDGTAAGLLGAVSAGGGTLLLLLAAAGMCLPSAAGRHRERHAWRTVRKVRQRWWTGRSALIRADLRVRVTPDGVLALAWAAGTVAVLVLLGLLSTA